MRIMSLFAPLLILCCLGLAFNAPDTLNSSFSMAANLTGQDVASDATPEVKAKIQSLNSPNPKERAEAACALGSTRASAAIPALIKTLGDDAPVDQPVCGQKGSWRDSEINKTSPGEMAAVALSRIGLQAVEPLIGALKTEAWQARANAAFALGLIRDERSIEPLIGAVTDTEWHVRSRAAWSLGLVGDRRAVEPLVIALKDVEWKVRAEAAWALGLKGDERAVEGLVVALTDGNSFVQSQAAWALGLKGDDRSVAPLTIALRAEGADVRSQAAWALGLKGDARAVEPLIAALRDTNSNVRSQVAWALGLKGDERAIEPLKVALNDADEQVRKQAAWALRLHGLKSGQGLKLEVPEINVNVEPKVKVKSN